MSAMHELTKQEQQVLARVARGQSNARIAQELYVSIRTVESHLYRLFKKLKVTSRTEAAIYAFHSNLVSNPELSGSTDDRAHSSNYYMS